MHYVIMIPSDGLKYGCIIVSAEVRNKNFVISFLTFKHVRNSGHILVFLQVN